MSDKEHEMNDETRERISLYALGALPPEEKPSFEEHLSGGCVVCAAELRRFAGVVGELGFAPATAAPPPGLREDLLARVARAAAPAGVLLRQAGLLIARSSDVPWQPGALPGLFSRPLFVDPRRRYGTELVRMEPGTRFPSHRHVELEELFMLEGDLHVHGVVMGPGDYCRADAGSVHDEVHTETGALFIVMSSQANELLA